MVSNWYDASGWYEPLEDRKPEYFSVSKKNRKKMSKARIGGLIALAFVLVASAAYSIVNPGSFSFSVDTSGSSTSGIEIPENIEDLPEDFKDYFSNLYTTTVSPEAVINIPVCGLKQNFSLEFNDSDSDILSLSQLYEKCSPSIVGIEGYENDKTGYSWGTGIILNSDGLILTNTHVIDNCDEAKVRLISGDEYDAELVGADAISDVALLKIEGKNFKPASFGDSSSLQVGESVAAIGNPLGDEFILTLTDGIISAIDRDVNYNNRSMTLLQTNTALNEGNSGGALFNMKGQVIGITNMKMTSSFSSIEGIGFAIPSSTVRNVVDQLVKFGEVRGRPSIGISVGAIPENIKSHYDLPEGLFVASVSVGSDAQRQGILEGDILTGVNGEPVKSSEQVNEMKNEMSVGDKMTFTIWRDGDVFDVDITLVETNDIYK